MFYSTIHLTRGYNRTVLFDALRSLIHYIPNELMNYFEENDFRNLEETKIKHNWLEFFYKNDLFLNTENWEKDCFPKFELDFKVHKEITHVIIELSEIILKNMAKLSIFPCDCHFYFIINELYKDNSTLFDFINNHESDVVEFGINDKTILTDSEFVFQLEKIKKFVIINILFAIDIEFKSLFSSNKSNIFLKSKNDLPITLSKGLRHFIEAHENHTYFSRKVFINRKGEIKNSFNSMIKPAKINKINKIDDILMLEGFKQYWNIKKSNTDVCKDCEIRFACVDNRLPKKRNRNEWYHEFECGYNPYISKMSNEEGYKTLSECGVISNENEFSIDHEKIAKINAELWPEE